MSSTSSGQEFQIPIFGVEAQLLIACNQRLQELGIQDTIQLPRIVVIGDQSTGKSSLIEAISNIKVPKAAGLCTKCPIAINLSSGGSPTAPWTCTVYVENKFYYEAGSQQRTKVNKVNPIGPWKPYPDAKAPTKVKTIYDRAELAKLIDEAQKHVLDPHRTFQSESKNLSNDLLEKFSPNPIRLDISMGDWPNLSFVDLPGVIQTAGRGEPEYLVKLVENLARQHAQDENNIILLTLPINHDVSNSKSYSIMQSESAQARTMAVFTKVDIARKVERDQCIQKYFTGGDDQEFKYGHHLVMLAESKATNSNSSDPRSDELQFFSGEPWARLSEEAQERLGIRNLVNLLRKILFRKTADTLPSNLDSIRTRLQEVEEELSKTPIPPDVLELPYQLREQINEFENQVKQLFMSSGSDSPGHKELTKLMEEFSDRISRDRPTLFVKADAEQRQITDAQRRLQEGTSAEEALPVDDDSETNNFRPVKGNVTRSRDDRVQRFRLEDIRELNRKYYQGSVPGEIQPRALEMMNMMSVQYWDKTLSEIMNKVSRLINREVLQCVDVVFGPQKHLQLYNNIVEMTKDYLDRVIMEHWTLLERRYDAEKATPLTFNQKALKATEFEVLEVRRTKRKQFRLEVAQTVQRANHQKTKKQPKLVEEKDLGPDDWDMEVQMSAKTRAYYDVASHRFVDGVCQEIRSFLIPTCHKQLVDYIKASLGLDNIPANRERITILMAEDPERERLRARLVDEKKRLVEGDSYIRKVLGSSLEFQQPDLTVNSDGPIPVELPDNAIDKKPQTHPGKRKPADVTPETPSIKRTRSNTITDEDNDDELMLSTPGT